MVKAKNKYAFFGDCCNISEENKKIGESPYNHLIFTDEVLELNKYKDLLKQIFKIEIENLKPELYFKSRIEEYKLPKEYIVLAPFSAYFYKDYPLYRFYNFLNSYTKLPIIILGTEEQRNKADFFPNLDKKFINLCGKTTLLECMDIINNSKEIFGVDSGLIHVASALNIKNVVIVGQAHYERFLPWSDSTRVVTGKDKNGNLCPYKNCNWRCAYKNFQCVKLANLEETL
jgi:ADP-heptose:LPS heptosyltransferase